MVNHIIAGIILFLQEDGGASSAGLKNAMLEGVKHPDLSKFLVIGAMLFIIGVAGVSYAAQHHRDLHVDRVDSQRGESELHRLLALLQETGNVNAIAGQIFAVFVIVVAAAEAAIGLGIVIALYRNKETIWVDEIDLLKW